MNSERHRGPERERDEPEDQRGQPTDGREGGSRETDEAMGRLTEDEILERMMAALDRYLELGFAVHLIAVRVREATEYALQLYPDGAETTLSSTIQEVADDFRLNLRVTKDKVFEYGWAIVLYPRW